MTRKRKPSTELTPRQARFVELYVVERNATRAYAEAYGVKVTSAGEAGSRLLKTVKVKAAVEARLAKLTAKAEISAQRVLEELARVAFSDMRRYANWGSGGVRLKSAEELSEDDARCVSEVSETITKGGGSIRFKLHDKVQALTLLGKHLGMFPERLAIVDPAQQTDEDLAKQREVLRRKLALGG